MDSLLSGLFGDQDDGEQGRAKAEDFVNRVESGAPTEGFSDEEAIRNYSAVASRLSPKELEESAAEAFDKLSPEQRREFAEFVKSQGGGQVAEIDADDPRQLAQATTRLQQEAPNGLAGLLGGGSVDDILGGLLGGGGQSGRGGGASDLLGGLLGGDKDGGSNQSGGVSGLLGSPIAKAALGLIAAQAMKRFMR